MFRTMVSLGGTLRACSHWYAPLLLLPLLFACEPAEEIVTDSGQARLAFSTDTVFFDTVFTSAGSITRRLKVFNTADNALNISRITLGGVQNPSPYSLIINGQQAQEATNLRLLGRDSLLVLVKVLIDPDDQSLPFLVQDSVVFEVNGNQQDVKLVSWGQNARFFRGGLNVLPCNATWTSEVPLVIYDSLLVPEGCTLTIEKGTRVHLAPSASLFVGGSLQINGTFNEPVTITSIRTDQRYNDVPGQWDGIYFLRNSRGNSVNWCRIRNGTIGLYLGTPDNDTEPDLRVYNSVIENMALFGVQCVTSDLEMVNTLVNRCVNNTLRVTAGGNYRLLHNTFAAVSREIFREDPSFIMLNVQELADGSLLQESLNVELGNNIIWGRLEEEIFIGGLEEVPVNVQAAGNLLKTGIAGLEAGNLLNLPPNFVAPAMQDFRLDTLGDSPAINAGIPLGIPRDLLNNPRDEQPDTGAYEYVQE